MSKGVLILAMGHPYYGNYAVQLARSIKAVCPTINITIAHEGVALSHNLPINIPADKLIEIPKEYFMTNNLKDYLKAKSYAYELSPYDQTIYMDADVIWTPQKPISELFDQLKDLTFTMANRGVEPIGTAKEGFIHWSSPKKMIEEYNLSPKAPLYNAASEFIYFKKCKEVKKMFKEAQRVFDFPPTEFKKFAHNMPDELAFEIAMIKTNLYPHASPFLPFYWEQFERKNMPVYDIYKNYYGYSMGGNINTGNVANIYNNLANHYNSMFSINGYFPAKDKRSFLPERKQI